MAARSLPSVSAHGGLTRYLEEIRQFPMLEPQEEYMLAKSWREHGDRDAANGVLAETNNSYVAVKPSNGKALKSQS